MYTENFIREFDQSIKLFGIAYLPEMATTGTAVVQDMYAGGSFSPIFVESIANNKFDKTPEAVLDWAEKITKQIVAAFPYDGPRVIPIIRSIRAGMTRNHNIYRAETLRGTGKKDMQGIPDGILSWTTPTAKPMIKNHDTLSNEHTQGRIRAAMYCEEDSSEYLIADITEATAVEAVKSGRLITGSRGSNVAGVHCNICGKPIGWACDDHELGLPYKSELSKKTELAGRQFDNVWAIEYSSTPIPADSYSGIVKVLAEKNGLIGAKSLDDIFRFPESTITATSTIATVDSNKQTTTIEKTNNKKDTQEINELIGRIKTVISNHDRIHDLYQKHGATYLINDHKHVVAKLQQLGIELSKLTGSRSISLHKLRDNKLDESLPDYLTITSKE